MHVISRKNTMPDTQIACDRMLLNCLTSHHPYCVVIDDVVMPQVVMYCHTSISVTARFLFRAQDRDMMNGDFAFFTFGGRKKPYSKKLWTLYSSFVDDPNDLPRRQRAFYVVKQVPVLFVIPFCSLFRTMILCLVWSCQFAGTKHAYLTKTWLSERLNKHVYACVWKTRYANRYSAFIEIIYHDNITVILSKFSSLWRWNYGICYA